MLFFPVGRGLFTLEMNNALSLLSLSLFLGCNRVAPLCVAPRLWGCNTRVSEKNVQHHREKFHRGRAWGTEARHRKETVLGSKSESVAELRLGSQLPDYLINTLSTHSKVSSSISFIHSDISLRLLFVQPLLEKDKESCYDFCDTCLCFKVQDPIELNLQRSLTEATEAQGSEIACPLLHS